MKTVLVMVERCIGCRQCELACAVEHSRSKEVARAMLEQPAPHARIHVEAGLSRNTSFPVRCRHCDPAPCEQVCPTGAIHRDPETELVLIASHKCITCAMCAMVCPFDALTYHPSGNGAPGLVATKCDGCVERIRADREPACVEACKSGALVYGELDDLVRSGRLRSTARVLAAAEGRAGPPGHVAAWRGWGEDVAELERRVS